MEKKSAKPKAKVQKKPVATKKITKKKAEPKKPVEVADKQSKSAIETPRVHKISKHYMFSIGRRKASIARARYFVSEPSGIRVNGKNLNEYFGHFEYQQIVQQPLRVTNLGDAGLFEIRVVGGGLRGQAESARLAISRILLQKDSTLKPLLKAHGLLVRDSRVKERKKYGLKSARRAPQWQKR